MDTRTIGTLTVSEVGLGCNNFGMLIERKESDAVVGAALNAGITLFDTADMYGGTKSEEYLGQALGARRDQIVLATKFGAPFEGHTGGAAPAYIRSCLEESLRRLGTDHIDLYQQHYPDPKTPIAETLGTLGELVAEGKIREIGCSNFDEAMLEEAAGAVKVGAPGFVSVQNEYNLLHRDPEDAVLGFCERTHTAFLPYFPLASGLLSGKYRSADAPEGTRLQGLGLLRQGPALRRAAGHGGRPGHAGPQRGAHRVGPGLRLVALPAFGGVGHCRGDQARAGGRQCGGRSVEAQRRAPGAGGRNRAALNGRRWPASHRRHVDQQVVGDEADRHVHHHQHAHGPDGLALMEDVEIRE